MELIPRSGDFIINGPGTGLPMLALFSLHQLCQNTELARQHLRGVVGDTPAILAVFDPQGATMQHYRTTPKGNAHPPEVQAQFEAVFTQLSGWLVGDGGGDEGGCSAGGGGSGAGGAATAESLREEGNRAFKRKDYGAAAGLYSAGLRLCDEEGVAGDGGGTTWQLLRANRAEAHLRLRQWPEAEADAEAVLAVGASVPAELRAKCSRRLKKAKEEGL